MTGLSKSGRAAAARRLSRKPRVSQGSGLLALPRWPGGGKGRGQCKPSPHETRELSAKVAWIMHPLRCRRKLQPVQVRIC